MDRDEIKQLLADADPLDRSQVEEWRRTDRPRAVLDRVLSSPREAGSAEPVRRRPRRSLAWVTAAGLTIVAAAVALIVWTAGDPVTFAPEYAALDRGRALSTLVAWSGSRHPGGIQAPLDRDNPVARFRQAATTEIMAGYGSAAFVGVGSATWADAIAWIWAAYQSEQLPLPPRVPAAKSWSDTESGALEGLVLLGIVPPDLAAGHAPGDRMTDAEWEYLLQRLKSVEARLGR